MRTTDQHNLMEQTAAPPVLIDHAGPFGISPCPALPGLSDIARALQSVDRSSQLMHPSAIVKVLNCRSVPSPGRKTNKKRPRTAEDRSAVSFSETSFPWSWLKYCAPRLLRQVANSGMPTSVFFCDRCRCWFICRLRRATLSTPAPHLL